MSRLPPALERAVAAAWGARLGREVAIADSAPVGGGCISATARLRSDRGEQAFLKWGMPGDTPAGLFAAEATSLRALRETNALRVPEVIALGESDASWLLLEWLEPGRATARTSQELGRGLVALHRHCAERFGWPEPNFIGSLPQANDWSASWPEFWRAQRLEPQLARAAGFFSAGDRRRFDRLLSALPELLAGAGEEGASLVHGDLWGGNLHVTADGTPALIDPSSYYGHREVDHAMSELFGGFDRAFYAAYDEAWPRRPGYREHRRAIYQIYYLLVHVNLFGGGYVGSTLSALAAAGV